MTTESVLTVILAAGQGTRMRSQLPKVLHKVAGLPMLEHVIRTAEQAASGGRIAAVYRPGMEDTAARYTSRAIPAYQQEQLGTADAVKSGYEEQETSDVTVIMYADTPLITPETVRSLINTVKKGAAVCVAGFTPADAGKYGRLVAGNLQGELDRIVEYNDANEQERAITLCNSGIMAVDSAFLSEALPLIDNNNVKGEYYLTDLVALARDANKTACYITADEDEFYGVNNREELSHAEAIFQRRIRSRFMQEGVTLISPDTIFFSADTSLAQDVVVEPHVFFGPNVTVGSRTIIKGFSHIEGSDISEDCQIGPYARLRPGTTLENGVKIGNFVEVKKSTIGEDAKINHLSYIGDADIGRSVNIGAGSITCNYDGTHKHRTEIGEGAFIGSNCSLIAPLHIGAYSVVGAASALTKDVPERSLAVGRSRQIIKKDYVSDSNHIDAA